LPTLPESLKAILRRIDYGALTAADAGCAVHVFIKLPHYATKLLDGPLPIRHFLFVYAMPTAPIVGWFFEIRDNPEDPLQVDTYFNVLDPVQARDLERLALQKVVPLHFVDGEDLTIVATKGITPPPDIVEVYAKARNLAFMIPEERYDFDQAKAEFQAAHSLDEIAKWQPSPWERE
jgi:hypothetical protein